MINIKTNHLFFLTICFIGLSISSGFFTYSQEEKFYPIYQNKTEVTPIYKPILIDYTYSCYDGVSKNITCTGKKEEYVFDHFENKTTEIIIIGYTDGKEEFKGFVNLENNILYEWKYDYGKRNFKEFGICRKYEKEKGVCHEYK